MQKKASGIENQSGLRNVLTYKRNKYIGDKELENINLLINIRFHIMHESDKKYKKM